MKSSSATATTIPPVERDGSLLVAGDAVEAEEGTGFLLTGSFLGAVTLGRADEGVEVVEEEGGRGGGFWADVSSREGRPRSIILLHFSEARVHCSPSPLSAIVGYGSRDKPQNSSDRV